jgi:hypothetical protein
MRQCDRRWRKFAFGTIFFFYLLCIFKTLCTLLEADTLLLLANFTLYFQNTLYAT